MRTGLITTDVFRDLLEIGRQRRPDLSDMQADKPPVLVSRDLRVGVVEPMRHDGAVEHRLDEDAVRRAAEALRDAGVQAVAICFLYLFLYLFLRPAHEDRAGVIVAEVLPEMFLSTSHEVSPTARLRRAPDRHRSTYPDLPRSFLNHCCFPRSRRDERRGKLVLLRRRLLPAA